MSKIATEIVKLEWEAFQAVKNDGGRACCQDDVQTFSIMRSSQIKSWLPEVQESYYQDLISAKENGRNLMEEKYAHMMAYTAPTQYVQLKPYLPPISDAVQNLVDESAVIHMKWQEEYVKAYPKLARQGREVSDDRGSLGTSFETYLRGELLTYSEKTLNLYLLQLKSALTSGMNLNLQVMEHTVRAYGYSSIAEAEGAMV